MTPDRLAECLRLVRWQKDILAEVLDVPSTTTAAWLAGTEEIPRKVGAWIEALCFVHEAAEETRPTTAGKDGKDVIRDLRAWSKLPIIVLSARDREIEKIEALDLGADDYVEKPFGIGELLARIRTALRHREPQTIATTRYAFDGLSIDLAKRLVTRDRETVHLTPKEYDLLAYMARHAGLVTTHRQLLKAVWGRPAHVEDIQYLRVFVGQLRSKIERNASSPRLICTEPAVGYRFAE